MQTAEGLSADLRRRAQAARDLTKDAATPGDHHRLNGKAAAYDHAAEMVESDPSLSALTAENERLRGLAETGAAEVAKIGSRLSSRDMTGVNAAVQLANVARTINAGLSTPNEGAE